MRTEHGVIAMRIEGHQSSENDRSQKKTRSGDTSRRREKKINSGEHEEHSKLRPNYI